MTTHSADSPELRRLGVAGTQVSAIAIGGNTFGTSCDEPRTASILNTALDVGINFIDTADSYGEGRSEQFIGAAIRGRREEVVIATKTGARSEPGARLTRRRIIQRVEQSLKRLQTDYIDLYYLHFPDALTPIEESLRAMDDLVTQGKVVYPACSNYPAWEITNMVWHCRQSGYALPVVSQSAYNLLDRKVELELLPTCEHFGLSLVPYTPLAGGFLTGKYTGRDRLPAGTRAEGNLRWQQRWLTDRNVEVLPSLRSFADARGRSLLELAIGWLLSTPIVCSVIAGATDPNQVRANADAAGWRLTPSEMNEIDVIVGELNTT